MRHLVLTGVSKTVLASGHLDLGELAAKNSHK